MKTHLVLLLFVLMSLWGCLFRTLERVNTAVNIIEVIDEATEEQAQSDTVKTAVDSVDTATEPSRVSATTDSTSAADSTGTSVKPDSLQEENDLSPADSTTGDTTSSRTNSI